MFYYRDEKWVQMFYFLIKQCFNSALQYYHYNIDILLIVVSILLYCLCHRRFDKFNVNKHLDILKIMEAVWDSFSMDV